MMVIQVSTKGQILIPKAIRDKYGVKPGTKVQILEESDSLIIRPAPEDPIAEACGFIKGNFSLTEELIREHKKELKNE